MAAQLFSLYPIPSGVTGTQVSGGNNKPVSSLGRSNMDGINFVWGVYSTTATTLSVSDVVHLFSVPEGATILDGWICGIVKSGTGTVVKVGVQAGGNPSATGVSTDGDLRTAVTLSTTRVLARFRRRDRGSSVPNGCHHGRDLPEAESDCPHLRLWHGDGFGVDRVLPRIHDGGSVM
jgi:hypothetical protein